ncbi:uncharacterized protein VP01_346g8 [Puccinia sorghi]|uniref:Uncharacterized protein n=1 Tax=Puccinia sorghi TaxID=27349 RepID=A0A0L6UW48_9BASI|nr:uncharacterized protein VP01_346g8 [Puccinia sorghi]
MIVNNMMWLLMGVIYCSGVIEAQLGTGQSAPQGPPQSSMPARTMAQLATASPPQQFLSQTAASVMAGTAPTDGGSQQAAGTAINPPPSTPPTIPSPQMKTPAINSSSTPIQKGSNQSKDAPPPSPPTQPASSNMKQASNASAVLSQAGSTMAANTTELAGGRMMSSTMGDATKNRDMLQPQEAGAPAGAPVAAAASLVAPTTPPRNGTIQPTASPPTMPQPSAKLAPVDPPTPVPTQQPIMPMESPQPAVVPNPEKAPASPDGIMMMSAPPSMAPMTPTMAPSPVALPTTTEGIDAAATAASSSSPDLVQLIATEKFNNGIETTNGQDEQKAQELINQLKAASKMKLSTHQLGNQTIFLNSLTPEQKMILESRMKTLSLTATQIQLERNYLATFVSERDKMAHQAGFEAIKKTLTPEAQRAFDPSEGMKSLQQLTEEQKYLYQEGSREFLEDPGTRLQAAASHLSALASPLLISCFFSAAFTIIV